LWLVTSRRRKNLALRLRQARIDESWFAGLYTADEQPAQKPDPRCFEPVWAALVACPGHPEMAPAIYVGDRAGDHAAASAAGIPFLAVLTGPEVRQGFPGDLDERFVVEDATHIPRWLDEHGQGLTI
jgi:phosphoglycolate phosphatase